MNLPPVPVMMILGGLCIVIVYFDLRYMRIPDWISGVAVAVFVIWAVFDFATIDLGARLITASVVFVICFVLFGLGMMGGGDTKAVPALTLFIPFSALTFIMLLFAACLFASIAMILVARKTFKDRQDVWAVISSPKRPMGIAIGTTGVITLVATTLF